MTRLVLAILCLAWTLAASGQGIYTWRDAEGRVHFGDRPPPAAAAREVEIRVNTYETPSGILKQGQVSLHSEEVVIYTTRRCGYCKKAKRFFRNNGIPFTEYDVETSRKGKRDYQRLNGRGVPIILVGRQRLNGYDEARLRRMLKKAGYNL